VGVLFRRVAVRAGFGDAVLEVAHRAAVLAAPHQVSFDEVLAGDVPAVPVAENRLGRRRVDVRAGVENLDVEPVFGELADDSDDVAVVVVDCVTGFDADVVCELWAVHARD
jgi:hypothetical protein